MLLVFVVAQIEFVVVVEPIQFVVEPIEFVVVVDLICCCRTSCC